MKEFNMPPGVTTSMIPSNEPRRVKARDKPRYQLETAASVRTRHIKAGWLVLNEHWPLHGKPEKLSPVTRLITFPGGTFHGQG